MARFGLKPSEILMVDDMKLGCLMANAVGVPTAFAAWSKQDFPALSREMRALADFTFDAPAQLEHFLFEEA